MEPATGNALLIELQQVPRLEVLLLAFKLMATGLSVTLLLLVAGFVWFRRHGGREQTAAALCFTATNLFAALYIASDALVRRDVLLGDLDTTLIPYRMALSSVILAGAAYVGLYLLMDAGPRAWSRRKIYALGALALVASLLPWFTHPYLVIAGEGLTIQGYSAFADYGVLAPWYFAGTALVLVLMAVMFARSPTRRTDPLGWRLNLAGMALFLGCAAHDALREQGVIIMPFNTLWLGLAILQLAAFMLLALHYSRLLQERRAHELHLQQLRRQLALEPLTGLYSKAHMEASCASAHGGGLLLIDLDDFKAINDHYGHLAGDEVLRELGRILRDCLRGQDMACRWGGDEFLLYLPATGEDGVRALAARLFEAVAGLRLEAAPTLRLGLSLGYAALDERGWRDALQRADQAMYRAKAAGKNRLALDEGGAALPCRPVDMAG